jgi:hypothetical protein
MFSAESWITSSRGSASRPESVSTRSWSTSNPKRRVLGRSRFRISSVYAPVPAPSSATQLACPKSAISSMSRTDFLLVGKIAPTARGFARKERKKRIRSCMSIFMLDITDIPCTAVEKHLAMQVAPPQNLQTSPPPHVA